MEGSNKRNAIYKQFEDENGSDIWGGSHDVWFADQIIQ